jgi:hypothetical protein
MVLVHAGRSLGAFFFVRFFFCGIRRAFPDNQKKSPSKTDGLCCPVIMERSSETGTDAVLFSLRPFTGE